MSSRFNKIMIVCSRMDKNKNLILRRRYSWRSIKMMSFFKRMGCLNRRLMNREWRSMIKLYNILKPIIRMSLILSKNGMLILILTIFLNINSICWGVRKHVTVNQFLQSIKNDNFLKSLIKVNKICKRDWQLFIKA